MENQEGLRRAENGAEFYSLRPGDTCTHPRVMTTADKSRGEEEPELLRCRNRTIWVCWACGDRICRTHRNQHTCRHRERSVQDLVYCYVCGGHADDEGICLIPCLGWELLDVERPLRPDDVEASRQQAMDRWGSIAYHVGLYQPHE